MQRSPYNLIHALAATAVLFALTFCRGFSAFWTQFLHGLGNSHSPQFYLVMMASSAVGFGILLLLLWASAQYAHARSLRNQTEDAPTDTEAARPPDRLKALRFTLCVAPGLILIAFLLCGFGTYIVRLLTGVTPADQDLIRLLADNTAPLSIRVLLSLAILFQAPLIEEALFRGVLFRGLAASLPLGAALALSGLVFAVVHVNAASFLALWYLGVAFAWLYHRTGTILAPMTAHFLFNATNLLLVTFFPHLV